MRKEIYIGCAGWTIPKEYRHHFPERGTHLQRYSHCLNAVEINSTFYRPHRRSTFERWAASVPEEFRFAVKIPRSITHQKKLVGCEQELQNFLESIKGLGNKCGALLLQLPPSLEFHREVIEEFLSLLREKFSGKVVCEPRHHSWFTKEGEALLKAFTIARAAVDPPPHPTASQPAGDQAISYFRLHGSPKQYYSEYSIDFLNTLLDQMLFLAEDHEVWCIFNNTASGAAFKNALQLLDNLSARCQHSV
ncbi:MAG: DUF72 domain-containing protein [Calditrichaeota bacterium]|nr:MAG: DUF72 domain-containing protein [Calditrichota bacterium]